jgi:hypothetical protein
VNLRDVDDLWIDVARRLDVPVARGGDSYVHWDGQTLHLAHDSELDDDDSLAQLILHELCHALVQGSRAPDWNLDNTSDRDDERERAALRLQAHLASAHGLRDRLFPTTVVRPFYESLGQDAFAPLDESARLALKGATRSAAGAFGPLIHGALARTAEVTGVARHAKTGFPLSAHGTCGGCTWRSPGGLCRHAEPRAFVGAGDPACARFEPALDCQACGACCRSAYDAVELGPREPILRRHPSLVVREPDRLRLARVDDHCAALDGEGPFACTVYEDRPRTCRDFERGGRHCLSARRRVGLSA